MQKSKNNLVVVGGLLLVLLLVVVVSSKFQNNSLNLTSKATINAIPLEPALASNAMLLGYSEISTTDSKYKLRISIPHSFSFKPQKIVVGTTAANEEPVTEVPVSYPCMGEDHADEMMMGYESEWTTQNITENLDEHFTVYFTDSNNKLYSAQYTLSHMCTVFADGYNTESTSTDDNLPPE